MEVLIFLLGCGIFFLFSAIYKAVARRRFRNAVAKYQQARNQRLKMGARPSEIPTVEQFLARRGELQLLLEIDNPVPAEVSAANDHYDVDSDGDGYEQFVAEMWSTPGIDLDGFIAKRDHGLTHTVCALHSLVGGEGGRLYLNLLEDNVRKTYAADSRHKWFVDGQEIDYSVFIGISRGADPHAVLRPERYPASFEEAMSERFDRFQTTDPKFAIAYQTVRGLSFRVVSRVIRSDQTFSARCHFRWGERRTFRKTSLLDVFDMQAWDRIDTQEFLKKRAHSR